MLGPPALALVQSARGWNWDAWDSRGATGGAFSRIHWRWNWTQLWLSSLARWADRLWVETGARVVLRGRGDDVETKAAWSRKMESACESGLSVLVVKAPCRLRLLVYSRCPRVRSMTARWVGSPYCKRREYNLPDFESKSRPTSATKIASTLAVGKAGSRRNRSVTCDFGPVRRELDVPGMK